MRLPLAFLFALPALAQMPTPIPPQLTAAAQLINDYGNTHRYAAENEKTAAPAAGEQRVVFMGDSITDNWGHHIAQFFPGKPYLNRGISGQVTAQMLLRFYPDVIAMKPKAVLILAGTNDIGGNIGPVPIETIENNLAAMAELARGDGIKVILASVTPVCDYHEKTPQTARRPPAAILELNRWIKSYCAKNGFTYLDYFSATVDGKGMFKAEITDDGLHPTAAGYAIMAPLAESAIAQALGEK